MQFPLNGTAVFDTTNGFMGVWHLNQNPGGTYPQLTDASSRHNHGVTNGSMSTSNSITGVVDRGVELDGVDDYINTTVQFNNPVAFTLPLVQDYNC